MKNYNIISGSSINYLNKAVFEYYPDYEIINISKIRKNYYKAILLKKRGKKWNM